MWKWLKRLVVFTAFGALLLGILGISRDQKQLQENLLRLHVVANSDSEEDQAVKLEVRDGVLNLLETAMAGFSNLEDAKEYVTAHLPQIEEEANRILQEAGSQMKAVATFALETFPTRAYDTFRLPAGIYESLRITIGEGEGHNWWCVLFPTLCIPATTEGFEETAEASGMSDELSKTLTHETGYYDVRFRIMDFMGMLKGKICGDEKNSTMAQGSESLRS